MSRRPTGAPKPGPNVEKIPCPATLGSETHELTNRRGKTICVFCDVEWWALDEAARAS